MNRFEMTVISTLITNMENQLASLRTIIAASAQDYKSGTPAKPVRVSQYDADTDYTTEEDDSAIEMEIEKAIREQTQIESDTLGEVWQKQHKEMNTDGNEGRREG